MMMMMMISSMIIQKEPLDRKMSLSLNLGHHIASYNK